MKRILFITSIVFLLSSCGVKIPYKQYSTFVDYTQYTNQGFFISESNSISFDYEPIGSVRSFVESGYEVLKNNNSNKETTNTHTYSYDELSKMKFGKYVYASPDAAISELVSKAKEIGANGIINLDVGYIPATTDKNGNVISASSYIVSGMAIKH